MKQVKKMGRPCLSDKGVKRKFHVSVDPEVFAFLAEVGNRSDFINRLLQDHIKKKIKP